MCTAKKIFVFIAGFIYGLVLSYFGLAWGVEGPTLTLPLAASPLSIPALVLDNGSAALRNGLMPALILVPIIAAPFCWASIAFVAAYPRSPRREVIVAAVLLAHYIGIILSFHLAGTKYLLRPFLAGTSMGEMILGFYAAGQGLIWWAWLRNR
jgi:hypothetical protein